MGRRNKMTGTSEQFQYILRDESMHVNFGIDVINQIKMENPHLWDEETQTLARQMILEGMQLEIEYAKDTTPRGILRMYANMMPAYLQVIANRRLALIVLPIASIVLFGRGGLNLWSQRVYLNCREQVGQRRRLMCSDAGRSGSGSGAPYLFLVVTG